MTLFATLMGSLLLAPAFGALLLSHGYDGLAAAWQPAALGGTVCTRERQDIRCHMSNELHRKALCKSGNHSH